MTTELAKAGISALESYIAAGDIAKLSSEQRISLYRSVCASLGLNELTRPFEYLTFPGGKTILYATKSCTEQLRSIHGVSVVGLEKETSGDAYVVTVRVRERGGREDIATGVVAIGNLRGEALANALMKAETKAKRRATLSICGLAMLDETEVETIPGAVVVTETQIAGEKPKAAPAAEPPQEPEILEISPDAKVSVVVNRKGNQVWRIDLPGRDPVAVVDPEIGAGIEANQAFGIVSRCIVENRNGKSIVVRILEETVRA